MKFVLSTTLLFLAATANGQQCQFGQVIRQDWRSLVGPQRQQFLTGLRMLQQHNNGGGDSTFDLFVKLHFRASDSVHGYAAFLPWHRYFIALLEGELQRAVGAPVALPFWDWGDDASAPERAAIWGDDNLSFGRTGDDSSGCVSTGAFRDYVKMYPRRGECLDRRFANGDKLPPFMENRLIDQLLEGSSGFHQLRLKIEVPHGVVHASIGGSMENLQSSPNDPVFYLHHSNVDRLWDRWQLLNPTLSMTYSGNAVDPNGGGGGGRGVVAARETDLLTGYNVRVSQVYDTRSLCYIYTNPNGEKETPVSIGTPPVREMKVPAKLPDRWIEQNHMDAAAVKEFEAMVEQMVKDTNAARKHGDTESIERTADQITRRLRRGEQLRRNRPYDVIKMMSIKDIIMQ